MNLIGNLVVKRALAERRHLVTEIVGADYEDTKALAQALADAGYRVEVAHVNCEQDEAMKRNAARGEDNISAYYTEPFHHAWLMNACKELESPHGSMDSTALSRNAGN
jgi:hypothetical protein